MESEKKFWNTINIEETLEAISIEETLEVISWLQKAEQTAQKCTYTVYTVCIYSTGLYAHWQCSHTLYRMSVKPLWWCVAYIRLGPFCIFLWWQSLCIRFAPFCKVISLWSVYIQVAPFCIFLWWQSLCIRFAPFCKVISLWSVYIQVAPFCIFLWWCSTCIGFCVFRWWCVHIRFTFTVHVLCHGSYIGGPIEAWNKTNPIKDLRFLQHCKFTLQSSGL